MDEVRPNPNACEGMHNPGNGQQCPAIPGLSDPVGNLSEIALARREQILDAAEAIIAGSGIQSLSLGQIEKRAEMSRGQLTYYFPTKESILLAVYDRMLRRMIRERMQSDGPKPMTGRAWDCVQHGLKKHLDPDWPTPAGRELFSLLFTFLAQMGHREDYRTRLSQWYTEWRSFIAADVAGSVPEPRAASPRTVAALMQALVHGLDVQLMMDPNAFDRQEMFELCVRLLAPVFNQAADPNPGCAGSEGKDGDPE